MDLHYKREVTVGALVILAIVVFIAGSMWLGNKPFKAEPLYQARFENVGKLEVGSVVKISGVRVGRVRKVEFVDVGNVLVFFSLPPNVIPKQDASATIVESIAFSEAFLHVNPGTSPEPLGRDTPKPGRQETGFAEKAQSLSDRADSVMIGVQQVMNRRTADDLHQTMVEMQRLTRLLSERLPQTTDEANQTLAALRRMSVRLDSTLGNPGLQAAITRLDTVSSNLQGLTTQFTTTGAHMDTLLRNVMAGQGTFGKLATDSGLYTDARAASQSLKALLDELQKHPGKITIQVKIF